MKDQNEEVVFSIIIPVLHESQIINDTIRSIRETQRRRDYEIIIVDGELSGDTIKCIHDESVITIVSPKKGRGVQMNKGAEAAKGEVLLFLHADTTLPENALDIIENTLKDEKYVGGAFKLRINSDNIIIRLISILATFRSIITSIPYGDQVVFIRRGYFHEIGGYRDIPIMEDVELMTRIRRLKKQIIILPFSVLTSSRRWMKNGVIRTSLLNILLIILYRCGTDLDKIKRLHG